MQAPITKGAGGKNLILMEDFETYRVIEVAPILKHYFKMFVSFFWTDGIGRVFLRPHIQYLIKTPRYSLCE